MSNNSKYVISIFKSGITCLWKSHNMSYHTKKILIKDKNDILLLIFLCSKIALLLFSFLHTKYMLIWKFRFYFNRKTNWIISVVVFRFPLNENGKNMSYKPEINPVSIPGT